MFKIPGFSRWTMQKYEISFRLLFIDNYHLKKKLYKVKVTQV